MRPRISEFSFASAFIRELTNLWHSHLVAAPELPSLRAEGGTGGGYDLRLDSANGFIYFAQFKVSDYLRAQSAPERDFGVPYLRFHFSPGRGAEPSQHERLLALAADGHVVEYVAPLFHSREELDEAFRTTRVLERVLRRLVTAIGPLPADGDSHSLVYSLDGRRSARYSEPVVVLPEHAGVFVAEGFAPERNQLLEHATGPLADDALERQIESATAVLLGNREPPEQYLSRPRGDASLLIALARVELGAEVFIVRTGV